MPILVSLPLSNRPWSANHASHFQRCSISEPTIVMCDNRSVVSNIVIAASTLKKRHVGIAYHMCREAVASNIISVHHVLSRHNRADILTKSLASPTLHEHNSNIFRTGCDDLI